MSRFLSQRLQALSEYTPGEQPRDQKYIKLNTNESPFPPSDGVVRAITADAVRDLRLYCDPDCRLLTQALADRYGVAPENIFVSNGSDDILNFAFLGFGSDGVRYPAVTYGFYSVYAALHGLSDETRPMQEDFSILPGEYHNAGKMVVLANPNAQTGIALTLDEVEAIVASNPDHVVLIDEAYVDFGCESSVALTKKYTNLLVVQTFSKSRSMAGARLGFAIADAALIADLNKIKYSTNPYNINRLTQLAGTAALAEDEYYRNNCRLIMENREYTANELRKLGFFVSNSSANFVLAGRGPVDGATLYRELKRRGILVRHFKDLPDYVRITIGTKADMDALLDAIRQILKGDAQ